MVNEYLVPVKHKFSKLAFKVYFQSGETLDSDSLGESLMMLRRDLIA